MSSRGTPVMQQWAQAKRAYPDALIFFRLGDFYELFEEDAVVAARLLDLTLTSRNKGKPDEVPMAGVPHHAAHGYLARLLDLGHKVAICEQLADPTQTRGIVPRGVVRVVTPGTLTGEEQLEPGQHNWLAALELGWSGVGIALADVSTGTLEAAQKDDLSASLAELARAAPREIVLGGDDGDQLEAAVLALGAALPGVPIRRDDALSGAEAQGELGALAREATPLGPLAVGALGRALRFVRACYPGGAAPLLRLGRWHASDQLEIDATAARHLELVSHAGGQRSATLLGVLDGTRTPAGARLLRRRLLAPLVDVARIRARLDRVEAFVVHSRLRDDLRSALSGVGDLERIATRAVLGDATPRDLGALRDGLAAAAQALTVLASAEDELAQVQDDGPLDGLLALQAELARALVERPPPRLLEGAVFAPGFDAELDELDALRRTGTERVNELEARLRNDTGLGTLKVRFTRVFGWYIEVSRSQQARAPASWRRKQTVATGERFTVPELDELADRIAHAEERHREREIARFRQLVAEVAASANAIDALAERLARWDVAAALADVAHRHDYRKPEVDAGPTLELRDARHPVVERLAAAGRFVPNDVVLDQTGERLCLVTGPNMAGKSTLLRQVALITILAQMGSYVPARFARIGVVDRVLSRVGASDDLARGDSTFMVEMRETAEILRSATRRSLVILDEIGRGTSTFDGQSIAWAVAEHVADVIGARALFATHYFELTRLAESSRHVTNASVSAREIDGEVVFLHRLVAGAASRSYGVAVARLAGLPEAVLARARAVLASLEQAAPGSAVAEPARAQLGLFDRAPAHPGEHAVAETLRAVEVERLTPLDALQLVATLKAKL